MFCLQCLFYFKILLSKALGSNRSLLWFGSMNHNSQSSYFSDLMYTVNVINITVAGWTTCKMLILWIYFSFFLFSQVVCKGCNHFLPCSIASGHLKLKRYVIFSPSGTSVIAFYLSTLTCAIKTKNKFLYFIVKCSLLKSLWSHKIATYTRSNYLLVAFLFSLSKDWRCGCCMLSILKAFEMADQKQKKKTLFYSITFLLE